MDDPRALLLYVLLACPFTLSAQNSLGDSRQSVATVLGFERGTDSAVLDGWIARPPNTIARDRQIVHSGSSSARITRTPGSASDFSALTKSIPIDFTGHTITFRGWLRTENVAAWAGLWLREDGKSDNVIAFDNSQARARSGTHDWQQVSTTLPLNPSARELFFGALLNGTGTTWIDDLELLVDGNPIAEAPAAPAPAQTALDRDHTFDTGSQLTLTNLTPLQIDNLVLLARIWGFLKYHHPAVTSGARHWDYDLLRVLPDVLRADSPAARQTVLLTWIDSLGPVPPCEPCAQVPRAGLYLFLSPDIAWIQDTALLGEPLSRQLQAIHTARPTFGQFFVSLFPGVGNPVLEHEPAYPRLCFPDPGFQLLPLFRFWNILQYWSPNRIVAGQDWPAVLRTFVSPVALARDKDDYTRAMLAFAARVNDTHTNLWGSLALRPPTGDCRLPVNIRFVRVQAIVAEPSTSKPGPDPTLRAGDIINSINSTPVTKLLSTWSSFYADSNEAARLADLALTLTNGPCGPVALGVTRDSKPLSLTANRVLISSQDNIRYTHDLPGPAFRLLSPEVAYLKLSAVKVADLPHQLAQAEHTRGLIIDIRNYPSEFVPFALGSHLVTTPTPFATFTHADLSNPGAFVWGESESISPAQPHYPGKVVILVDETSISQAEYTAMALRAAPGAIIIGSTTKGADGNVSSIPLPGGLHTQISGIGVFYPDRRPTQRVGIIPDITVYPTGAGLRDGRDEILERAIREIVGSSMREEDLRKLAHPIS